MCSSFCLGRGSSPLVYANESRAPIKIAENRNQANQRHDGVIADALAFYRVLAYAAISNRARVGVLGNVSGWSARQPCNRALNSAESSCRSWMPRRTKGATQFGRGLRRTGGMRSRGPTQRMPPAFERRPAALATQRPKGQAAADRTLDAATGAGKCYASRTD